MFLLEKQDLEKDDILINNVILQLVNFIQKWDGDFFDYEKWANALGHIKGVTK